jgi:hypothetical protein
MKPGDDRRYVVRIEVFAAQDENALVEDDLDTDHMEALSEMLCDEECSGDVLADEAATKRFRYDLCPKCRLRFTKDPLNREAALHFNFSAN